MKKVVLSLVSAMAITSANAMDMSLSHVRDFNLDRNGVRVEASVGQVLGVTPTVGLTYVDDVYTRYALGTKVEVLKLGNLSVAAVGSGVFQDTKVGQNGFGLTVGAQASVDLAPRVSLTAGVERFIGHNRVDSFNGGVASVGLNVKF